MRSVNPLGSKCIAVVALVGICACYTNRAAEKKSLVNRTTIKQVKIGQTQDDVRRIMRHGPEIRTTTQMPDGSIEEVWGYVTDYFHVS